MYKLHLDKNFNNEMWEIIILTKTTIYEMDWETYRQNGDSWKQFDFFFKAHVPASEDTRG